MLVKLQFLKKSANWKATLLNWFNNNLEIFLFYFLEKVVCVFTDAFSLFACGGLFFNSATGFKCRREQLDFSFLIVIKYLLRKAVFFKV